MRKINLIHLGALAQKRFNMKDNFRIIEYPSDIGEHARVAIESSLSTFSGYAAPVDFDTVAFEKVGNHEQGEYAWMAYSARANVLAFHEAS